MNDESVIIDRYEPDYSQECDCCGQTPTVTAIKDNKVVADLGMCGVCTFGTAKALDVNWWNNSDE